MALSVRSYLLLESSGICSDTPHKEVCEMLHQISAHRESDMRLLDLALAEHLTPKSGISSATLTRMLDDLLGK